MVVKVQEAQSGKRDGFGQRYTLDFTIEWQNRRAIPRSDWIIETRFAETIASWVQTVRITHDESTELPDECSSRAIQENIAEQFSVEKQSKIT